MADKRAFAFSPNFGASPVEYNNTQAEAAVPRPTRPLS